MNADSLRTAVLEELSNIAPEADLGALAGDADVREALDIDSMDFLNFVAALHKRLGYDIPERDYENLFTVDRAVAYLKAKVGPETAT